MEYKKDQFHVVPEQGEWGVKLAGSELPPEVFMTRGEAVDRAREIAAEQNVCMVVHAEDGKFEEFDCKPEIRDQHVVLKGDRWAVLAEGGKEVTRIFPSKGEAMAYAYQLAVDNNVCMLVHGKDGKFQSVTCPPDGHPGILEVLRMKLKV